MIRMRALKYSSGFTLIELVLVVGLLGIAFGVTSDILISLVRSQTKTRVMNSVEQQANFISLKLEKELRNAKDVNFDGTVLTITPRSSNNLITYWVDSLQLRRGEGGNTFPLNDISASTPGGGVSVSCINVTCFTVTGTYPKVVNITLRFSAITSNGLPVNIGSVDINQTIVIRETYN